MTDQLQQDQHTTPPSTEQQTTAQLPVTDPGFVPEPLPAAPSLPFHIKADLSGYRQRLGVFRIVLAIALTGIIFFRFGWLAWVISVVVIGLTIFIVMFALSRRSVTLNADSIQVHSAFGRTTTVSYADLAGAKVFLGYIEAGFGHAPRIVVGKNNNKPLLSMNTLYWNVNDIDLLQATLQSKNVALETYVDPVLSATVAKQFPGYVSYFERHPYLVAVGIVFALLIAITVFVLLTM